MVFDGQWIGRTKKLLCEVTNYLNYLKIYLYFNVKSLASCMMNGRVGRKLELSTQTTEFIATYIKTASCTTSSQFEKFDSRPQNDML